MDTAAAEKGRGGVESVFAAEHQRAVGGPAAADEVVHQRVAQRPVDAAGGKWRMDLRERLPVAHVGEGDDGAEAVAVVFFQNPEAHEGKMRMGGVAARERRGFQRGEHVGADPLEGLADQCVERLRRRGALGGGDPQIAAHQTAVFAAEMIEGAAEPAAESRARPHGQRVEQRPDSPVEGKFEAVRKFGAGTAH
jgi:hypothetical protein